ncbi:MAG: hypothetical protein ACXWOX_15370, partial [Ktedonobacteraceae bacterium]
HQMQEQTVTLRGSSLGDAFGICWFLREVDGVRTIGHGGSAMASLQSCSLCQNGTSLSSHCPILIRMAFLSTRQSSAGRLRTT